MTTPHTLTDWAPFLDAMTDPARRERATTALEHALAVLPPRHHFTVKVTGGERHGRFLPLTATVHLNRTRIIPFLPGHSMATSEALTFYGFCGIPDDATAVHARYTGDRLTTGDLIHVTAGPIDTDGNATLHAAFDMDEVNNLLGLNAALAAQDLALDYRDNIPTRPPYARLERAWGASHH